MALIHSGLAAVFFYHWRCCKQLEDDAIALLQIHPSAVGKGNPFDPHIIIPGSKVFGECAVIPQWILLMKVDDDRGLVEGTGSGAYNHDPVEQDGAKFVAEVNVSSGLPYGSYAVDGMTALIHVFVGQSVVSEGKENVAHELGRIQGEL